HPPVWRPLTPFPAALVIVPVFGIPGASCLVSTPSGLSPRYSPGLPPPASAGSLRRAHPHSSVSALAIEEREQTLGTSNAPTHQLHVGTLLRRLVRSLSLRPSWLLASWADRTREGFLPQPSLGLYVRAFSSRVTPRTAGYDYGAKWGIAPTGLPPVSTVASLAALPPVGPTPGRADHADGPLRPDYLYSPCVRSRITRRADGESLTRRLSRPTPPAA